MCSIAWRWCPDQPESLILISNRDEFYDRPTDKARQWVGSNIWAGKDLRAGGTWLGVTDSGRLAAVTNHRSPLLMKDASISRGNLIPEFLESRFSSQEFIDLLCEKYCSFNPFNLMVYDGNLLLGFEGRNDKYRVIEFDPGFGSVSNGNFNSPWVKQMLLQQNFQHLLYGSNCSDDELLDLLLNDDVTPIDQLPTTGIPIDTEIALSSLFVRMDSYGTRASSLIRIRDNEIIFSERSFGTDVKTYKVQYIIKRIA
jgi:uncharacterized protein with NRDE domain